MKLFLAIALLVVDAAAVAPTHCNACDGRNLTSCYGVQENQTCATDRNSLGTSHCGSVAIKYLGFPFGDVKYGIYRGCIDCVDKKAACFALGPLLQLRSLETLLQCDIMCCTGNNCNNQTFNLTQDAITVFTPEAAGPGQCMECDSQIEADRCTQAQRPQTCDKFSALGTTHCGFAKYKFQDIFGVHDGFLRGCINCADKKAACAAISGYVKARKRDTVMDCNIECCTGRNCNDGVDPSLAMCNSCFETDAANCARRQKPQTCTLDRDSLGTTHCASLVAKYRLTNGNDTKELFYRGCIDCKSKKEACFAFGGFLKGDDDDNDPVINLLQCEIDCCTGRDCNTQVPTLSPNAIDVFTPSASGPKQCNLCLESDADSCTKNQQATVCATTDRNSLGTSHCGSAVGKYRDSKGQTSNVFIRGCINCADKKAACAAVGGFLKSRKIGPLMECEIECCTGDNCNTKFPSESTCTGDNCSTKFPSESTCTGDNCSTKFPSQSKGSAAAAIWQGYHIFPCTLLVLATTMAKM